jgi:hypothetical protein
MQHYYFQSTEFSCVQETHSTDNSVRRIQNHYSTTHVGLKASNFGGLSIQHVLCNMVAMSDHLQVKVIVDRLNIQGLSSSTGPYFPQSL